MKSRRDSTSPERTTGTTTIETITRITTTEITIESTREIEITGIIRTETRREPASVIPS